MGRQGPDRPPVAFAIFWASVRSLTGSVVGLILMPGVELPVITTDSPMPASARIVTVRPATFGSLITGLVSVTVFSAPADSGKPSAFLVHTAPCARFACSAEVDV